MTEAEHLPRIIHQMVEAAGAPRGHRQKVAGVYGQFIDRFTQDMAMRSLTPVNDIAMNALAYEHSAVQTERPKFPNGYPVIGIHFNDQLVGITGISFEGTECSMTKAETRMAQFLLKAKPLYLREE